MIKIKMIFKKKKFIALEHTKEGKPPSYNNRGLFAICVPADWHLKPHVLLLLQGGYIYLQSWIASYFNHTSLSYDFLI